MIELLHSVARRKRLLLNLFLVLCFSGSIFSVEWNKDLIHTGGTAMIWEILKGLARPNLSADLLFLAVKSTWVTIAYAVTALSIAIVLGFIVGILASGKLTTRKYSTLLTVGFFRGFLNVTRAIHELVWAWIFVASFGLSPFSGIFAMAIPYAGILGRILADAINDVSNEPIDSLKITGASQWQCMLYGYLPLVWTNMISYTMYRFECAVRSSAIMSFVGLGGLGYQIQLSLADLKFDEVWTFLFFLIGIVVGVDLWSSYLRKEINTVHRLNHWFPVRKISLTIVLFSIFSSWYYIIAVLDTSLLALFTSQNLAYARKFFSNMLGIGEEAPAFFSLDNWKAALLLSWETLKMSVLALALSALFTFITAFPGARNVADGTLTLSHKWYHLGLFWLIRVVYVVTRAVPELIWAMLIIFVLQPGLLPGALALAIHNIGVLGKLWAEVIEEVEQRPIHHLRLSGANKVQILFYGILPAILPKFLSFLFYRWEVIMRTTIVVGFIGAGGLGQEFKLRMSFFHYSEVTLLLVCYLLLVLIADTVSEFFRKHAK